MKKTLMIAFSLLSISFLQAQDSYQSGDGLGLKEAEIPEEHPSQFSQIEAEYDAIARSHFKNRAIRQEKIGFREGLVTLSHAIFITDRDIIGAGIGYESTYINWNQNPFFDRRAFNNVGFSAFLVMNQIKDWQIRANFSANVDTLHFDLKDYTFYQSVLWAKYKLPCACLENLSLNIGVIAQTGLDDHTWIPIVGVDFDWRDCWKFHLVYPVDMAIEYILTKNWSAVFEIQIWKSRHRLARDEPLSRGFFEYRNQGVEIGLNYKIGEFLQANVHAGTTLGFGEFNLTNKSNEHLIKERFKAAAFAGGNFLIRF